MTTKADLNYVLGILNVNEDEHNRHLSAFECCNTEEERAAMIKNLTDRSKMLGNKASEGVNKGTAMTVKASKAAVELANASNILLSTVEPNAEGKIGVAEVEKALAKGA